MPTGIIIVSFMFCLFSFPPDLVKAPASHTVWPTVGLVRGIFLFTELLIMLSIIMKQVAGQGQISVREVSWVFNSQVSKC